MAMDSHTVLVNPKKAHEDLMLQRVLASAKAFYQSPENLRAFEAWRKEKYKEANSNGTDHR